MSQTNINITEANESNLNFIRTLANINKVDVSSKEKLINFSIKIAYDCAKSLDDESLRAVANLKKSL